MRHQGLGDIINSTPVIVENPPYFYNFNNYLRGFKYTTQRDPLVYIGANDGALHAFMLTDKIVNGTVVVPGGTEVWRFYPLLYVIT
jgi:Tfp pilus tip-associated adhesin PilY1